MSLELKNKLNANAKHFRYLSRAQTFNRNRKSIEEVDYLKYYSLDRKQIILSSLQGPIPSPLPPLSPQTVSFYRRSNKAIFRTKPLQSLQLDGHMLYESLWILASLQEKQFQNYQAVIKQFQQDFSLYLNANSADIRQMAIIAAGNKILGKQADILKVVQSDPQQMWVLINHIYEKKISFKELLKHIPGNYEIVYKTLYQLTNNKEDESIDVIVKEQTVMDNLFQALGSNNEVISKYAIRIIGNIVAEQGQYIDTLHKYKLLDYIFPLLMRSNQQIRKDGCWLLSNLSCDRSSATGIMRNQKIMVKLVDLFSYESSLQIKKQVTRILAGIAHNGEKYESFQLLANQTLLQICYNHLCVDDNDLSSLTLALLNQLLQLGENYKNQQEMNMFCLMILRMGDLRNQISKKTYSEHDDISGLSIQITNMLEDTQV